MIRVAVAVMVLVPLLSAHGEQTQASTGADRVPAASRPAAGDDSADGRADGRGDDAVERQAFVPGDDADRPRTGRLFAPDPPRRGEGRRLVAPDDERRGPRGRQGAGPLSAEETEQLLEFTREHFPRVYERLMQTRQRDPDAFRQMVQRISHPLTRLMRMYREDPEQARTVIELQKIEIQLNEHRHRWRSATQDNRERIRDEVRRLLERKFELRQQRRRREIAELRAKLQEQERQLADQQESKEQIIDRETAAFASPGPKGRRFGPGAASRPAR